MKFEDNYLSEILDLDDYLEDCKLNLIDAQCGAGKTSLIFDYLDKLEEEYYEDCKLSNKTEEEIELYNDIKHNCLYLIDSKNGKQQLLQRKDVVIYDDVWNDSLQWNELDFRIAENKVVVMTYAQFGMLMKKVTYKNNFMNHIRLLVCDEMHQLINYKNIYGEHYTEALTTIKLAAKGFFEYCRVIGLTATPDKVLDEYLYNEGRGINYDDYINEIKVPENVRRYETLKTETYFSLNLLLNNISTEEKGIVYVPRISQMIEYIEELNKRGINAVGIWSSNNEKYPMNENQKRVLNSIIRMAKIPDDVQILFINKASETSINIESHVDYIIVHSSEQDVITQARGRFRGDLKILYHYDKDEEDIIVLKDKWLNKKLYTEDKNELVLELNIKKDGKLIKWTTIKTMLDHSGYIVQEKKVKGGKRYVIISNRP